MYLYFFLFIKTLTFFKQKKSFHESLNFIKINYLFETLRSQNILKEKLFISLKKNYYLKSSLRFCKKFRQAQNLLNILKSEI